MFNSPSVVNKFASSCVESRDATLFALASPHVDDAYVQLPDGEEKRLKIALWCVLGRSICRGRMRFLGDLRS